MTIETIKNDISGMKPLMESYKRAIEEEPLTEAQYKALERAVQEGSITFFVVKNRGEAVAMCSVSRTFSTFSCSYSGVFEDFYIKPEYRQKGVAGQLTKYVFDYCEANEIYSLWVGSAACDVEMYKHLGFEIPLGNLLTWAAD